MAVNLGRPAITGLVNYAATATITASEEAAGHDADNLKTASYVKSYRSTGVTAARNTDFDLGAVKTDIEAIVLWGVNFTDAATWRIFGDNTAGFGSPEHDSTLVSVFDVSRPPYVDDRPPWGRPAIYLPPSTWSARYVRIQVTDTANPDGYLEAHHASIGPVHQPAQMDADWSPGQETVGSLGRSVRLLTHRMRLLAASEAERRGVLSIEGALGATGRFGLIPRPRDPASWIYESGLFRLVPPIEEVSYGSGAETIWDLTLNVREVND